MKPRHMLLQLAVISTILALLLTSSISAHAQAYSLEVSKSVVTPGERFNITVCSEYPYDTLLLFVTGPEGEDVNLTIVRVYRGDVVGVPGVISITVDEEGIAVFEVEAPEKPGEYLLELATAMGEVVASTTFTVTTETPTPTPTETETTPARPTAKIDTSVALILLIIAIIIIIYWLWRHL